MGVNNKFLVVGPLLQQANLALHTQVGLKCIVWVCNTRLPILTNK